MAETLVARLGNAIGYPEQVAADAVAWTFRVDDAPIQAALHQGRLMVSHLLDASEDDLGKLAGFAVGRFLRDEAVLAWDPRTGRPFLWQWLTATDAEGLQNAFAAFADTCEWWRDRIEEFRTPSPLFSQMVINP